jgi:hypothetical protein
MTKLQALTLLRDSVQATRGISQRLWYEGHDQHCTIGSITQVAVDIGFPKLLARHMMKKLILAIGPKLKDRIVSITDDAAYARITPVERRDHIVHVLDNAIATMNEHAPAIPSNAAEVQKHGAGAVSLGVVDTYALLGAESTNAGDMVPVYAAQKEKAV